MLRRRWLPLTVAAVVVAAGLLAGWFGYVEPVVAHHHWQKRIDQDIKQLAHKRPPDVSRGQWEYAVGWTWNLHGNCAFSPWTSDRAWRDGFADELERRLAGPMTLADIEWVWDEYVAHTDYGPKYDHYRPTRDDYFPRAEVGCFGMPVD